jgi:capsular exopolysaccharide synthesis family protein
MTLLRALRRRWWLIALIAAVSAIGAYEFSSRKPKEYRATSSLLFVDSQLDQALFGKQVIAPSSDPSREAATNLALLGLSTVALRVANQLNIPRGRVVTDVAVGSDATSDVVSVTATDVSPGIAAKIANAYVQQYISFRQQTDRNQLTDATALVQSQLAAIPASRQSTSTYQNLLSESRQLQLLASLQTGNAESVQTALPPKSPFSPVPSHDALIGLILGLLVAGALVIVLERADRRIKTPTEVEDLYGVPLIGTVPESRALRLAQTDGAHHEQEAFRMMYAQLRYFDVDRDIRRVMITSADLGEGKSTVALNLARAAAWTGDKRALLIEADLRRPSLTEMIGVESVAGLAELLSHSQDLVSGLRELVVSPDLGASGHRVGFDVLLAGALPPNPAELLHSARMAQLLEHTETIYDIVIIDTPPIGLISDPISLIHRVDGVVLVSRLGRSRRDHATALMKQVRGLNANILGVVVNGVKPTAGDYAYYGPRPPSGRKRARRDKPGRERPNASRIN